MERVGSMGPADPADGIAAPPLPPPGIIPRGGVRPPPALVPGGPPALVPAGPPALVPCGPPPSGLPRPPPPNAEPPAAPAGGALALGPPDPSSRTRIIR